MSTQVIAALFGMAANIVAAKIVGTTGPGAAQPHVARPELRYSARMSALNYVAGIGSAVLDFLEKYNGALTAVSTAFIAAFTIVLARVTGREARLTTDALNLARQEFVANHRPRVILRYIQGPFENEERRQFIWVTFVNIGSNTATIEAFGADLARRWADTENWALPGVDAEPNEISPSGQRHVFTVTAREVSEAELELQIFHEATSDYQLCAVGVIRYRDTVGVARDTGFFRVLKGERFIISERDSEMEYQD
jgi:hypothetical protein